MKILVVDDSATMRRIIINHLKQAGYSDIVEASNGVEALSRMSGIELVLTDWNMPVMDGLSLVKEIRHNPNFSSVPIIMITTEGAKEEVLEALRNGVNDYIVKPFTKQIILEKIEAVVG
ncbi:response regulator [bacterium]|nr:response regulator [bacterium]